MRRRCALGRIGTPMLIVMQKSPARLASFAVARGGRDHCEGRYAQ